MIEILLTFVSNFNTSHVNVNQYETVLVIEEAKFQYISC